MILAPICVTSLVVPPRSTRTCIPIFLHVLESQTIQQNSSDGSKAEPLENPVVTERNTTISGHELQLVFVIFSATDTEMNTSQKQHSTRLQLSMQPEKTCALRGRVFIICKHRRILSPTSMSKLDTCRGTYPFRIRSSSFVWTNSRQSNQPRVTQSMPVQIIPSRGPFNQTATITLRGENFPEITNLKLQYGPVTVPNSHIVYASDTEIVFRSPLLSSSSADVGLSPGSQINISLSHSISRVQLFSGPYLLQEALDVDLGVFLSSYNSSLGMHLLAVACNGNPKPVLLASIQAPRNILFETPSYDFSYRLSTNNSSTSYSPLSPTANTGSDLVSLDPGFFSADAYLSDFVEVRVFVSVANSSGEAIQKISRKLQGNVVGAAIIPPQPRLNAIAETCDASDERPQKVITIRGIFASFSQCPGEAAKALRREWIVNGEAISSGSTRANFDTGAEIASVGLSAGVAIPYAVYATATKSDYFLRVSSILYDPSSGDNVAVGSAYGKVSVPRPTRPVALINGGEYRIVLSRNASFTLSGLDASDPEDRNRKAKKFVWGCRYQRMGADYPAQCNSNISPRLESARSFNVSLASAQDPSDLSAFTLWYSLTVAVDGVSSRTASLELVVVNHGDVAKPFGASSVLTTNSGKQVISTNPCRALIYQHESLILRPPTNALPRANDLAQGRTIFRYAVYSSGSPGENKLNQNMLFNGTSYWSSDKPENGLLGIRGSSMDPGEYILVAALNSSRADTDTPGSMWKFNVSSNPKINMVTVPITDGFAGQTVFYATASSIPMNSDCLYYFAIFDGRDGDADPQPITPRSCLGGCTGERLVAFVVHNPGTYSLQVDLVTTTSEIIDTHVSSNEITVRAAADDYLAPVAAELSTSLAQEDEETFFRSIRRATASPSAIAANVFEESDVLKASRGLREIARNSFLSPMRSSLLVDLSSGLLLLPAKVTAMNEFLQVAESSSRRIVEANAGAHLVPALARFYGNAFQLILNRQGATTGNRLKLDGRAGQANDKRQRSAEVRSRRLREYMGKLRLFSAEDIVHAAAFGRECGSTLTFETIAPEPRNGSDAPVSEHSKYFTSVSTLCYHGQPLETENVCRNVRSSTPNDWRSLGQGSVVGIVNSGAAYSPMEKDLISGRTRLLSYARESIRMPSLSETSNTDFYPSCLNVTFDILSGGNTKKAIAFAAAKSQSLRCQSAFKVLETNVVEDRQLFSKLASDEVLHLPTRVNTVLIFRNGTIRASVPVEMNKEVFVAVDEQKLLGCIFKVEGQKRSPIIAILSSLLLVLGVLALSVLVFYYIMWFGREHSHGSRASSPSEDAQAISPQHGKTEKRAGVVMQKRTVGSLGDEQYSLVRRPEQRISLDEESEDTDEHGSSGELVIPRQDMDTVRDVGIQVQSGGGPDGWHRAIDDDPPLIHPFTLEPIVQERTQPP